MDGWLIGLIALCVVGVAVIAYGGISDRRKHRRAVNQLLSPPPRAIPQLPADAPVPRYLSALQARETPTLHARPPLANHERAALDRQLSARDTVAIGVGFASEAFITDSPSGRAVLDHPRVLVSAEPVMSIRELISVVEHMIIDGTPLVVVAPSMAPEVLDTLEVNHIQRRLDVVVVLTRDPQPADAIVQATRASLISRVDLQTGYLADPDLGRCARWISDRRRSYIIVNGEGDTRPEYHQPDDRA